MPTPTSSAPDPLDTVLAALADPTRRTLLERLLQGSLHVAALAQGMPVSRPAVSQHLKILKNAGLVEEEPQGRHTLYRARPEALQPLTAHLRQIGGEASPPNAPAGPDDNIDAAMAQWATTSLQQDPSTVAMLARLFLLQARMNQLYAQTTSNHGLSIGESMILGTLRRTRDPLGLTPSDIARISVVSRPGTARRLARLESLGLIQRQAGPSDQRSHRIRLTSKGETVGDAITHEQLTDKFAAFFHLPPSDRQHLNLTLKHLLQALKNA